VCEPPPPGTSGSIFARRRQLDGRIGLLSGGPLRRVLPWDRESADQHWLVRRAHGPHGRARRATEPAGVSRRRQPPPGSRPSVPAYRPTSGGRPRHRVNLVLRSPSRHQRSTLNWVRSARGSPRAHRRGRCPGPVRRGRVPGTSRLSRLVSPRPRRPLDSAGHAVARSMAPMWCYPRRSPRIRDVEPALSCVIRQPARQVAEVHRSANDGDRPQLLAPDGVAVLIAHPEPASIVAQSAVTKHALALGLERPRVTPCHIALPEISETFGQSGHVAHLLR
jgi:hypothetical protein